MGFDIGGSSVKAVLARDKKIIKSRMEKLPAGLEALLKMMSGIIDDLKKGIAEQEMCKKIGVGIAGALDSKKEKILKSPNIPYLNEVNLKKILEERTGIFIELEHDVRCFLLAEREIGLAKNFKNVFYLTLGTGVGSAWMLNGELFSGAHKAAGEAGHMVIDFKKGEMVDLEKLSANKFIVGAMGITPFEAYKKAEVGDIEAIKVFQELGRNLGVGIANIINIVDPEAIILSGGISLAREFILPGIRERIEDLVLSPEAKKAKILFSELGIFGGALGAALMVQDSI